MRRAASAKEVAEAGSNKALPRRKTMTIGSHDAHGPIGSNFQAIQTGTK